METQYQEVCSDNLVNNCQNVIETFNRNICNFVNQTVCENVEETWYKDECQYEKVYEEVCSYSYSNSTIRYRTECGRPGRPGRTGRAARAAWPASSAWAAGPGQLGLGSLGGGCAGHAFKYLASGRLPYLGSI